MKKLIISFLCSTACYCFLPVVFAENPAASYSIEITNPTSEETFQNDTQSITVAVSITPALAPEDKVAVYVDGTATAEPIHATNIEIPYLERGPHTIQAKIIQKAGNGAESSTITIYQQRSSALLSHH